MDMNMIINMIWATMISTLVGVITAEITRGTFSPFAIFHKIIKWFKKEKKITGWISIYGTRTTTTWGYRFHFPEMYRAVIYKLLQKNINFERMTKSTDAWADNSLDVYIESGNAFTIEEDICISFNERSENGAKDSAPLLNLTMNIYSYKYTVTELNKIIKNWIATYEKETKKYIDDGNKYYFSLKNAIEKFLSNDPDSKDKDKDKDKLTLTANSNWKSNILTSYKTFDNTFFTDKNILLKKLNYFLNNEHLYRQRGIPYNIGFLLYGDPGCGKTSCIKAISNLTNRHVVEVNLKKIKTCADFERIFTDNEMAGKYIPHEKKIIVLEDIDCMINIIQSRKKKEIEEKDPNSSEFEEINKVDNDCLKMILIQEKMSRDVCKTESYEPNDKLTLACILNTIDGVLENYGRILIITTNFIDKLDEALIRPGRIDMKINFTKCTNVLCREIIENFYTETIDPTIKFPDYLYTPAEILELCQLHYEDINIIINKLKLVQDLRSED